MFDLLQQLYRENAEFLNGAASVATIFATYLTFRGYRRKQQKKLYYQWSRTKKVKPTTLKGYKVLVSFADKLGACLTTDIVVISNRTDLTVTDSDFVKPIRFSKNPEKIVYQAEVVETGTGATADITVTQEEIILQNIEIPRNSTLTVFLSHEDAIEKQLRATTKSLPDVTEKTFRRPHETASVSLISFSIFLIFVIFLASIVDDFLSYLSVSTLAETLIVLFFAGLAIPMVNLITKWFPQKLNWLTRSVIGITKDEELLSEPYVVEEIENRISPLSINQKQENISTLCQLNDITTSQRTL